MWSVSSLYSQGLFGTVLCFIFLTRILFLFFSCVIFWFTAFLFTLIFLFLAGTPVDNHRILLEPLSTGG